MMVTKIVFGTKRSDTAKSYLSTLTATFARPVRIFKLMEYRAICVKIPECRRDIATSIATAEVLLRGLDQGDLDYREGMHPALVEPVVPVSRAVC